MKKKHFLYFSKPKIATILAAYFDGHEMNLGLFLSKATAQSIVDKETWLMTY